MDWHFIESNKVDIQAATAAGSFVTLISSRRFGWFHALTLFIVGQILAYYWTLPLAQAFHWDMGYFGVIGFSIGSVGMLVWSGFITLCRNLRDDPKGTLSWGWRLWRGDSNGTIGDDPDAIPPGN